MAPLRGPLESKAASAEQAPALSDAIAQAVAQARSLGVLASE